MLGDLSPIERNVDVVFVIDASKSMELLIEKLQQADSVYDELFQRWRYKVKSINRIRFKVIWYRNFFVDGDNSYGESKFFEMPDERVSFREFLCNIQTYGGCSGRRPGLAALAMAMNSDFVQDGDIKRHIVVLFTDATSYSFEEMKDLKENGYSNSSMSMKGLDNIPDSLDDFYYEWCGVHPLGVTPKYFKLDWRGRRLVLVAPTSYPWDYMEVELENTLRVPIEDISGTTDVDLEKVFDIISYGIN